MIKREQYLKKIRPLYHQDLIKVLVGIRRCGKSVILMQMIDELKESGVKEDHIIFMNFENLAYQSLNNETALYEYVEAKLIDDQRYYLFFDEIQNVEHFELAINSFRATHTTSIFITGSNGKLLSSDIATYLTGRFIEFHIYPFSFREFLLTKQNQIESMDLCFQEYIRWGGMPQLCTLSTEYEKDAYLNDLYMSILKRDIMPGRKTISLNLVPSIFRFMVDQIGKTFSASSIQAYLKSVNISVSFPTLMNYIDLLCATMIFQKVPRYDIRGKKILTTLDKYYVTDIGIHQILKTSIQPNFGPVIENIVYSELVSRGYRVYVGKTYHGEVDFIATKNQEKRYIQACYYLYDEEVIAREFGAYSTIKDNYPKYVISMDTFDFSRDGIIHMNLLEFLLGKEL